MNASVAQNGWWVRRWEEMVRALGGVTDSGGGARLSRQAVGGELLA